MPDKTHEAIITGLAEELGCSCCPVIVHDKHYNVSNTILGQYEWESQNGLRLTVSISAGDLKVFIHARQTPVMLELANPNLVRRIRGILDTCHRLIDIGDEAAKVV